MKSANNNRLNRIKKYKKKQLILIIVLLICISSLVSIFGKYVTNSINDFFLRSKEFYFYSDKLSDNTSVYQIDNWPGVGDYTLTINMNSRKNNIRAVDYDIGYNITYTCSDNAICQLDKTSGIIPANTNSDTFVVTITPNRQLTTGDKVEVEITAKSDSQYKKTLKGKFTLVVGKENLTYDITDSAQSPYLDLSFTNTLTYYNVREAFDSYSVNDKIDYTDYLNLTEDKKRKCYSAIATINFNPGDVLLDMTSSNYSKATNIGTTVIDGKTYVNRLSIEIDAISSIDLRFYKVDSSRNYTNNQSIFTITSI